MKINQILLWSILFFIGCNQKTEEKSELNYLSFKVSKVELIDSLRTATLLLDKLDYGKGTSCFVSEEKLFYTSKEKGFGVIAMRDKKSSTVSAIGSLTRNDSKQLLQLVHFFNKNNIHSMTKREDGIYYYRYMQNKFNKYADLKKDRMIVYLKEEKDTCSNLFTDMIILDRYKNIVLIAPENYNEPNSFAKNEW